MKIKFIFFDIGDVLFDENAQHRLLFHSMLLTLREYGRPVEWDEFDAKRRELTTKGPNPESAIRDTLAAYCHSDSVADSLWHETRLVYDEMRRPRPFGMLLDDITGVLRELRSDFHLGIIANQHPPVQKGLELYGIAPLFNVIVISEMVNLFKPDPAIFQYGLDKAGITPEEAIFVGDRADNDIRPAKALGMKTVRFQRGIHFSLYNPQESEYLPDETVTDVSELAAAVRRVAAAAEEGR